MRLDLACGQRKKEGFLGVDIAALEGVDIVCDLGKRQWYGDGQTDAGRDVLGQSDEQTRFVIAGDERRLIPSNSAEEIYCSHYVEHTENLMAFMDEVWRVCKHGAEVTFIHPYYTSIRAFQDPTHTRYLGEPSWVYFNKPWRQREGLDHYPMVCDFDIGEFGYALYPEFEGVEEEELRRAVNHYWNVVQDLVVTLTAVKEPRGNLNRLLSPEG